MALNKIQILKKLKACGIEVQTDVKLADYTSFCIGGCANYAVKPKCFTEIVSAINIAKEAKIPYCFMGKGSNLLVCDSGYRGMVILTCGLTEITLIDDDKIKCQAGVTMAKLCNFAYANSLSGLEFAWGIPGSVGGGIYMNAGAYGGEFKDVVVSCEYVNEHGELCCISVDDMEMSYRHSFFCNKNLLILSVTLKCEKAEKSAIKEKMDCLIDCRRTKQPLEYPSCGSTFKRPQNGYAAALIEECGLKGYRIGDAQVSEKHSGFVINVGNATCNDVLDLIEHIKAVVLEKKGVALECEVKILGK